MEIHREEDVLEVNSVSLNEKTWIIHGKRARQLLTNADDTGKVKLETDRHGTFDVTIKGITYGTYEHNNPHELPFKDYVKYGRPLQLKEILAYEPIENTAEATIK